MDIQSLSVNMSQSRVQEEAAAKVQAMILQTIRDESANLSQLVEAAKVAADPARGNFLDMYM